MNNLCMTNEEVFAEFEKAEKEVGARLVKNTPEPGEPGFAGSPGGLSAGIPGLKELPLG